MQNPVRRKTPHTKKRTHLRSSSQPNYLHLQPQYVVFYHRLKYSYFSYTSAGSQVRIMLPAATVIPIYIPFFKFINIYQQQPTSSHRKKKRDSFNRRKIITSTQTSNYISSSTIRKPITNQAGTGKLRHYYVSIVSTSGNFSKPKRK